MHHVSVYMASVGIEKVIKCSTMTSNMYWHLDEYGNISNRIPEEVHAELNNYKWESLEGFPVEKAFIELARDIIDKSPIQRPKDFVMQFMHDIKTLAIVPQDGLEFCLCGCTPSLKTESRTCGHNESVKFAWVECKCGLATKRFDDHSSNLEKLPIFTWNNLMTSYTQL